MVLGASCRSKELGECEAGKTLATSEHLHRCAALIKAPSCRQYVLDLDGGALRLSPFADRCRREYCGQFSRPVPLCVGKYGTPAEGYGPELDFFAAVFETDYGATSELPRSAFFEAVNRQADERSAAAAEARRQREHEARLILRLTGDGDSLNLEVLRPGGVADFAGSLADFEPDRCRALISNALDGGSLGGKPVLIRAGKKVIFRSIHCFIGAAIEAGAAREDIDVSTLPAE